MQIYAVKKISSAKKTYLSFLYAKMKVRYILLVALLAVTFNSFAQQFRGGVSAGLNFAQMDGLSRNVYGKLGLNAGAFVAREILPEVLDWQLELNYSSKGNYNVETTPYLPNPTVTGISIADLKYIEMPLSIQYYINNRMKAGAGLAPDVLIKEAYYDENGALSADHAENLNRFSINALVEFNYLITRNLTLGFRFTHSLTRIYKFDAYTIYYFKSGYFNDVLRFNLTYYINKP